jgi:hypothetical protein
MRSGRRGPSAPLSARQRRLSTVGYPHRLGAARAPPACNCLNFFAPSIFLFLFSSYSPDLPQRAYGPGMRRSARVRLAHLSYSSQHLSAAYLIYTSKHAQNSLYACTVPRCTCYRGSRAIRNRNLEKLSLVCWLYATAGTCPWESLVVTHRLRLPTTRIYASH